MNWTQIKKEYITSNDSLRMLSEKHRVSLSTIKDRSHTEGWVESRRQFRRKSTEKLIEKESDKDSDCRVQIYSIAVIVLDKINELIKSYPNCNVRLREITGALKDVKDILDLKSELDIEEQNARIAVLESRTSGATEDKEITVRFEGLAQEWAG